MNPSGGAKRVVASHAIARRAFRAGAAFAVAAVVWAIVILVRGGSWWGPIHAFLAGAVLLAIAGASQMFTITWAASPPPPVWMSNTQRWLLVAGTTLVLVSVTAGIDPLVWVGAAAVAIGLIMLGASIIRSVRRSLLRRFDLSARFYLVAFGSGAIGVTVGAILGTDAAGSSFTEWRVAHSHINLVALVGFTIIGTLPTFLVTLAHNRVVSGREALVGWWMCLVGAGSMIVGIWLGRGWVGAGTVLAGLAAFLVLGGILQRLWSKGKEYLQFIQVSIGVVWLAGWAIYDGVSLLAGATPIPFSGITAAAILAGVGQVLLGSLGYLVPVLKGPPLGDNFARMTDRPWLPLLFANLGGAALIFGFPIAGLVLLAAWVIDFAIRLIRVVVSSPSPS